MTKMVKHGQNGQTWSNMAKMIKKVNIIKNYKKMVKTLKYGQNGHTW